MLVVALEVCHNFLEERVDGKTIGAVDMCADQDAWMVDQAQIEAGKLLHLLGLDVGSSCLLVGCRQATA